MPDKKNDILELFLRDSYLPNRTNAKNGFTTKEISGIFDLHRTYVSTLLNQLIDEKKLVKSSGRPVKYFLYQNDEDDEEVFSQFSGSNGSFQNTIETTKAACIYPKARKSILFYGNVGTGKYSLAHAAINYSKKMQVVDGLIKELDALELHSLFSRKSDESYKKSLAEYFEGVSIIVVKNVEQIASFLLRDFFLLIDDFKESIITFALLNTDLLEESKMVYFQNYFDYMIPLKNLSEYSKDERSNVLEKLLVKQARITKRKFIMDPILFKCLMTYETVYNFRTLEKDIQEGCSKSYSRQFKNGVDERIYLSINDFSYRVREALFNESNIPVKVSEDQNRYRAYDVDGLTLIKIFPTSSQASIQNFSNYLVDKLKKSGNDDSQIAEFLKTDFIYFFNDYLTQVLLEVEHERKLIEIVGEECFFLATKFLTIVSNELSRTFSKDILYVIGLFLNSLIKQMEATNLTLSNMLPSLKELSSIEYEISEAFLDDLKEEFSITYTDADLACLILTILDIHKRKRKLDKHPSIVIIMHGDQTATSLKKYFAMLLPNSQTFAYDIDFSMNNQQLLNDLKALIIQINNPVGVLIFYDMGEIKNLTALIQRELKVPIKCIELPSSLVIFEAIKKSEFAEDLSELSDEIMLVLSKNYHNLDQNIHQTQKANVVVALSREGTKEAYTLKKYLEENEADYGYRVVALASDDKEYVKNEISELSKISEVNCIIGTYDPGIFNIPFLSVPKFLSIPKDMLRYLLLFLNINFRERNFSYELVESHLNESEEIAPFELEFIKKKLADHFDRLQMNIKGNILEKELTFFMYLCMLRAGKTGENPKTTRSQRNLIRNNKILYNRISDLLAEIVEEMHFLYSDYDLANLIGILKGNS